MHVVIFVNELRGFCLRLALVSLKLAVDYASEPDISTQLSNNRSSRPKVFCKKGVLRNFAKFTGKHLCQILFLIRLQAEACIFIKKETLAQVFSSEFYKISKNTFSYRTPPVAASGLLLTLILFLRPI